MKRMMMVCLIAGAFGISGAEGSEKSGGLGKDMFLKMDVNGDEKVSLEEYVHFGADYMTRKGRAVERLKMERCFRTFDRDGNGFITRDESDLQSAREACAGRIDAVTMNVMKKSERNEEEQTRLNKKTGSVTIISTTTRIKSETPRFSITVFNAGSRSITYSLEWYCLAKPLDDDTVFTHDKGCESITVGARKRVRHSVTPKRLTITETTIEKESATGHISNPCVLEEGRASAGYVVLLKYGNTILDKKASSKSYLSEQWISKL